MGAGRSLPGRAVAWPLPLGPNRPELETGKQANNAIVALFSKVACNNTPTADVRATDRKEVGEGLNFLLITTWKYYHDGDVDVRVSSVHGVVCVINQLDVLACLRQEPVCHPGKKN